MPPRPRTPWTHSLAALLGALLGAAAGAAPHASGQETAARGGSIPVVLADSLVDAGQVERALALLEEHLARDSADFQARWRAARAAVFLGVLASGTEIENGWYRRGMVHADRALAADPDDPNALQWAVAAKGSLAVQTGARESARLSREVWELAHRTLALDPTDAYAHYALGKVEYEVLGLNRARRFLARRVLGADLPRASWTDALAHLERAVALDPGSLLYRLGLADALWKLDRRADAVAELETVRALPRRLVVDSDYHERAALLLRRIGEGRNPDGSMASPRPTR